MSYLVVLRKATWFCLDDNLPHRVNLGYTRDKSTRYVVVLRSKYDQIYILQQFLQHFYVTTGNGCCHGGCFSLNCSPLSPSSFLSSVRYLTIENTLHRRQTKHYVALIVNSGSFRLLLGQFDIFFFILKVFDACLLLRWPLERILRLEDVQMPLTFFLVVVAHRENQKRGPVLFCSLKKGSVLFNFIFDWHSLIWM
jgi:hypothetical protein